MRTLFALLALSLAARAGVTIVDPGLAPGGALLQAAIDAAPSGEILLLKPGYYANKNIVINGKLLSLVGDGDPSEIVLRNLHLQLPLGSGTCLVRGLSILDTSGVDFAALLAESPVTMPSQSSGLWVEDCTVHANKITAGKKRGIEIYAVSQAVLVRTEARGGDGSDEHGTSMDANAGGIGLRVTG